VHRSTTKRHDDDEAVTVFGRIRDELYDASKGGLFVAADGHSAWLRDRLHDLAAAHNMSIVARNGFGGQAAGDRGALADNYVLSRCAVLVRSRESTFFDIAATRAAAKNDQVRAVWVCPRDDSVEDSKSHRRRRTPESPAQADRRAGQGLLGAQPPLLRPRVLQLYAYKRHSYDASAPPREPRGRAFRRWH
jgi:hypothetical protein